MVLILFSIALVYVTWKLFVWGLRAAWSIMKFVCMVILLPIFLMTLVFMGLIYLAIPILIIVGIVAVINRFTIA